MSDIMNHGYCKCGGRIIKMWGGVDPWYYCGSCGIVSHSPGRKLEHTPKYRLKCAMDKTWDAMDNDELDIKPFVIAVGFVLGKPPVFTINEMIECGYKLRKNKVVKIVV